MTDPTDDERTAADVAYVAYVEAFLASDLDTADPEVRPSGAVRESAWMERPSPYFDQFTGNSLDDDREHSGPAQWMSIVAFLVTAGSLLGGLYRVSQYAWSPPSPPEAEQLALQSNISLALVLLALGGCLWYRKWVGVGLLVLVASLFASIR